MNKLITSTPPGGFPLVLDDLRWFLGQSAGNQGIYQALNNLLRLFGNSFAIQGVLVSGTTPNVQITEGWVMLDGELLKVDAQTGIDIATDIEFVKETSFDTAGDRKAQNGSDIRAYQINRAVVSGLGGGLNIVQLVRFEDQIIPAIRDRSNSASTESNKGLIEIATQAETDAVTDDTKAITPKKLGVVQASKADKVSGATSDNLASLNGSGNLLDSGVAASQVPANAINISNLGTNKLDKSLFIVAWDIFTGALTNLSASISSIDSVTVKHLTIEKMRILDFDIQLTVVGGYSAGDSIEFRLPSSFGADVAYRTSGFWNVSGKRGAMSIRFGETAPNTITIFDSGGILADGTHAVIAGDDQIFFSGQLIYRLA